MPTVNQREVFDRPPPGVRKIVIATNIAETSITIDDVVFVVDCGKIKVKDFKPEMNLTSLEPQWVSKANAKQRRGRAGRVQPGHCFHLYTKFCYDTSLDYLPPEMLRTRLEELCLQIKLLKLGMIVPFIGKAMQHPSIEAIEHAVETLIDLQALDRNENLLPLGYHLARMPVEPHTGKMILFGAMFCCLDPILTGKEVQADEARKQLSENSKSDHIMLINAYKGWERSLEHGDSQRYCWENFLSQNTLKMLKDMKRQLAELLHDIGFVGSKHPKDAASNINSGSLSMIRAVLCAGLYPNVAQVSKVPKPPSAWKSNYRAPSGVKMSVKGDGKVFAHPKSVNFVQTFFESKWMVYYHKLKTSKVYVHDSTMVSPYPLLFFGGEIQIIQEDGTELVSVDDWVKFRSDRSTAMLVK
ncbi:ATP-dependent RNA helicase DHX36, partial [Elysia marginata]